jgi:hypothetical protein
LPTENKIRKQNKTMKQYLDTVVSFLKQNLVLVIMIGIAAAVLLIMALSTGSCQSTPIPSDASVQTDASDVGDVVDASAAVSDASAPVDSTVVQDVSSPEASLVDASLVDAVLDSSRVDAASTSADATTADRAVPADSATSDR